MFHSPARRHRSAQPPPGWAPYFDRNLAEAFFAFPFLSRFFRLSGFSAFPSFPRFFKKQKPLRRRENLHRSTRTNEYAGMQMFLTTNLKRDWSTYFNTYLLSKTKTRANENLICILVYTRYITHDS